MKLSFVVLFLYIPMLREHDTRRQLTDFSGTQIFECEIIIIYSSPYSPVCLFSGIAILCILGYISLRSSPHPKKYI